MTHFLTTVAYKYLPTFGQLKTWLLGGSPALVFMGGDSWLEGCEFESQHINFLLKMILLFVWYRTKNGPRKPIFEKHHFLNKRRWAYFWAPFGKIGLLFIGTFCHTGMMRLGSDVLCTSAIDNVISGQQLFALERNDLWAKICPFLGQWLSW